MEHSMKIKQLIAAGVAAATVIIGTPAIAQADAHDPGNITVAASDVDITSKDCYSTSLRITGLPDTWAWIISVWTPDGGLYWATNYTPDAGRPVFEAGFCSSLVEGHYSIRVEGVTYGGFEVYRPHLDAAPVVEPGSRTRAHRVAARLTIHGAPMVRSRVVVRKHVSGHRGTKSLVRSTDGAGMVRAKCPRGHRCTFRFDYGNGFALSRVVRIGRR